MPKEKVQVTGKLVFCEERKAKNGGRYFRCGIKPIDSDKPVFWNASERPGEIGSEVTVEVPAEAINPTKSTQRSNGNGSRFTPEDADRMSRSVALKAAAEAVTTLKFSDARVLSGTVLRLAETFFEWITGKFTPDIYQPGE